MRSVYKFSKCFGRQGDLSGICVEDDGLVEKAYGKEVYADDVLGKHSEVQFILTKDNFVKVSRSQEEVDFVTRLGLESGFNPIDYLCDL